MKKEMEDNLNVEIKNYDVVANGIETELFLFSNLFLKSLSIILPWLSLPIAPLVPSNFAWHV